MPYKVFSENGKNCVHKMDGDVKGRKMGCHGSKAEAMAQMRALYHAEGEKKEIEAIDKELAEMGMETKEIEALTAKCMGEMGMYVPWSIKSFSELDAWKEAQEMAHEVSENTSTFGALVQNIMNDPEIGMNEKTAAVKELADEFASRVDTPMPDHKSKEQAQPQDKKEQPDESLVERVVDRLKAMFGLKPKERPDSGFMVYKESDGSVHWVARYSNHYRDQDNPPEIISSQSHLAFTAKVEKGLAPLPELWIWHVKEWRIGKADWVAFDPDSGFAIAGGHSLPGCEPVFDQLAAAKEVKVSHGMPKSTIVRDTADESIIIEHETREISPLPGWAAANKLTGFVVLEPENKEATDMAIPADKREALIKEWNISEDLLAKIEAANAADANKAKDEGLEHKEAEATPVAEPVQPPAEPVAETPAEPVQPPQDETAKALSELVGVVKALAEKVVALEQKQASEQEAMNKALGQTPAASIMSMFGNQVKSAIGADETVVDGRTSLAKSKPAKTKQPAEGRTLIPFINDLLAGQQKGQQQ